MVGVQTIVILTDHAAVAVLCMNSGRMLLCPAGDVCPLRCDAALPEVRSLSAPRRSDDPQVLFGEDPRLCQRPLLSALRDPGQATPLTGIVLEAKSLQILPDRVIRDARVRGDGRDVESLP